MNKWTCCAAAALAALSLASCQKLQRAPAAPPVIAPTPLPAEDILPPRPPQANNIDDYKLLVASHILRTNSSATFSGRLPPMLPAIVVLEIRIGRDGEVQQVRVVRSRDKEASRVAMAAVHQGAPFPRPGHLLQRHQKSVDFAETFLFNREYQFQLRTLAGPQ